MAERPFTKPFILFVSSFVSQLGCPATILVRAFLLLVWMMLFSAAKAEPAVWFETGLQVAPCKGCKVQTVQHVRTTGSGPQLARSMPELRLEYGQEWWDIGAAYRYIWDYKNTGPTEYAHESFVYTELAYDVSFVEIQYRFRWQREQGLPVELPETELRHRVRSLLRTKAAWRPFISYELFSFPPAYAWGLARWSVGSKWRASKRHRFSFAWMHEAAVVGGFSETGLAIDYLYRIPRKKNKNKRLKKPK